MNLQLSIIVPVYNVEKYLHRCMESLLAQNIDNSYTTLKWQYVHDEQA